MAGPRMRRVMTAALMVGMTGLMTAQERDRSKVSDKFKWNLAEVYPSEAAWRAEKDKIAAQIPQVRSFQGTLGSSAPHPRLTVRTNAADPA